MARKLYIKTFGCQMNEYDSARMADVLTASHGFVTTEDPAEADVLLVNTCSVREKPQEKLFSQLGMWREYKEARPGVVLGVGGCVASQEGSAIWKRAPYVDIIFGPQTVHRLPQMLDAVESQRRRAIDISFPEIEKFDRLPEARAEGPTAFVSIMEGCSKYCTFCVVPYTRGEEFSRPFDDVLAEIAGLAQQGVREVTLLGQNVNAYRGAKHDGGVADLAELIRYVAAIDGIGRIRFTTSHPVEFSDRLVEVYSEVPELVDHLHLPVQSGSDRVLALMKRGHTVLEYKAKIRRLRKLRPKLSLSTDFIVGFPGETDADFAATMRLIDDVGFDTSFSFVYSRRPGTPASNLPDDVPMDAKKHRLAVLQRRIEELSTEVSRRMVGGVERVLVTGASRKDPAQMSGRTENNHIVNFDGPARLAGEFVDVRITEALPNSLRGQLLNQLEHAC
ncbi:MAG: tRNA (N6-isopentenyl adenosine(37)-C2)-methylthiotransferase MiaB [Gammaproteobacteria bacterium]